MEEARVLLHLDQRPVREIGLYNSSVYFSLLVTEHCYHKLTLCKKIKQTKGGIF